MMNKEFPTSTRGKKGRGGGMKKGREMTGERCADVVGKIGRILAIKSHYPLIKWIVGFLGEFGDY